MSDTLTLMALFHEGTQTAEAIDELHALGIPDDKMIVITGVPYPERALGRQREWLSLPYIVLAGAGAGLIFGRTCLPCTPGLADYTTPHLPVSNADLTPEPATLCVAGRLGVSYQHDL